VVDEVGDEACPPGLARGAEAASILAVEVLVERDVVAKMRVVLELGIAAEDRPAAVGSPQEQGRQPSREFVGDLAEAHLHPRAGGTFDLEVVAVVIVKAPETFDHHEVDRHPDRAAPVRVAPEKAAVRLARQIFHAVMRAIVLERIGMVEIAARQGPDAVRRQELGLVQHPLEDARGAVGPRERQEMAPALAALGPP
jgi:hypothetical protein